MGARIVARFLPVIGAAVTAYDLYRWYQGAEVDPHFHVPGNWAECYNCHSDHQWVQWTGGTGCVTACNQAALHVNNPNPAAYDPIVTPPASPSTTTKLFVYRGPLTESGFCCWFRRTAEFRRVSPGPVPTWVPGGHEAPIIEIMPPQVYPIGDPLQLPIGRPAANPTPWPVRAPRPRHNPFRHPWEQPHRGPRPRPARAPQRAVEVFPRPGVRRNPLGNRRPPPGQRDIKVRIAMSPAINAILGPMTESLDILYCLYRALPRERKDRVFPTPQRAAQLLYEFLGSQDRWRADRFGQAERWHRGEDAAQFLASAMVICVRAQIMDFIFGFIGSRIARRWSARMQEVGMSGVGIQFGPALGDYSFLQRPSPHRQHLVEHLWEGD